MRIWFAVLACSLGLLLVRPGADAGDKKAKDNTPPAGFTAIFNGKDLTGWQGLLMAPETDPKTKKSRSLPAWLTKLSGKELEEKQKAAKY